MVYYQSNLQHEIYGKPLNIKATPQDNTVFMSVVQANDHITQAKNELAEILPTNMNDSVIHAKLPVKSMTQDGTSILYVTDIGLILYTKLAPLSSEIKHISYSQISHLEILQTEPEAIHLNDGQSVFTSTLRMTIDGNDIAFQVKNIWSKSRYVNLKPLLYHLIMLTQKGASNAQ